ncbi:tyrosine--tRNA ligase [Pseudothermotoga thermarum]|uniref:Tyrosine--tRNA ligase n=1 Tax=Pseudothermotoga thermarum DSM 5069 TaxID=688269 RepID=F7YWD1_9THEM|nr:tyrosine--tRNA ligase [Pseudothermotoga thermarum]AEH51909.1 tyrosyl-tRNA synthetase [Pseudothermotoga thermarum DSM 5069]
MQPEKQVEYLTRNVVDLVSREELLERIRTKGQLRVKLGVDPSRPDLHLGHAVVLFKLREFQDLGHHVILIIGDFTAMIGDPSGRNTTRPMLSEEEVKENAKTYQEQAFKILDPEKTEVRFNSEWLGKMTFADVIKLAAKYTVARMLERDDFAKRYASNEPISISEFLYPLAQAYDSVAIQADVELGGTDQYFNLLVGRKIQEEFGQKPQIVMTMPIIEGTDGKLKMSKSYGNYIAFNDPPLEMYGKLMSIPDELIIKYMRLLTKIPDEEIDRYEALMNSKSINPRDVKMRLAFEITKFFHGEEEAKSAEEEFIRIFREKELPTDIPVVTLDKDEVELVELLVNLNVASSRSEARRLITQGGVRLDDEKILDIHAKIILDRERILKVGKRNFFKLKRS